MFSWDTFISATSTRSLYVLGAGASAPIIGTAAELENQVRASFWKNGIFPAEPQSMSPLKSAILGYKSIDQGTCGIEADEKNDIKRIIKNNPCFIAGDGSIVPGHPIAPNCFISSIELDNLTPPAFIEASIPRLLTRSDLVDLPQYRVFDYFYPSIIFNFNVDNLADVAHPKHERNYPHGKIDPGIAHSPTIVQAIQSLTIPASIQTRYDYWRPLPECQSITTTGSYSRLKEVFPMINFLCIIGYSFGAWGGGMDDNESFEMLTDLLRWKPKPVLIVNPTPSFLVDFIGSAIHRKTVYGLGCKWNILAEFIISGQFRQIRTGYGKLITNAYLCFENAYQEQKSTQRE